MLVLGIESSCDETAVALVRDGETVIASTLASQVATHAPFGGVVPEIAAREHLKNITPLFLEVLSKASVDAGAIDAIAVTQGPGLIGALLVGTSFAKGLALRLGKPLIPVDHVHAHIHGALLGLPATDRASAFPALGLVVSGGHTNLYYMNDPTSYKLIAHTIDDACGECFDKVAKLFGLGYPGGPAIEKLATHGDLRGAAMPRMVERKSQLLFSYSGLKTHMATVLRQKPNMAQNEKHDLIAAFQDEALGQLVRKLTSAVALYPQARSIIVAGGVAANRRLRHLLSEGINIKALFPDVAACSDNAEMIAAYGYHMLQAGKIPPQATWDNYPRYPFEEHMA